MIEGPLYSCLFSGDDYYMNREEAVKNIEKTVAELGQMYERFGSILAEQEQQTVRIRNDVDDYAANVR